MVRRKIHIVKKQIWNAHIGGEDDFRKYCVFADLFTVKRQMLRI